MHLTKAGASINIRLMAAFRILTGRYVRVNEAFLRERANRENDPRNVFYRAMIDNNDYEAYEAAVGRIEVMPQTVKNAQKPISGHTEILYAISKSWIEDASSR